MAVFAALGGSAYAAVTVTARALRTAGSQGPKGDTGERGPQGPQGDPGLNVAGTRQVPNQSDIACDQDVVVGTLPVSVPSSSRIWTQAHAVSTASADAAVSFASRRSPARTCA